MPKNRSTSRRTSFAPAGGSGQVHMTATGTDQTGTGMASPLLENKKQIHCHNNVNTAVATVTALPVAVHHHHQLQKNGYAAIRPDKEYLH